MSAVVLWSPVRGLCVVLIAGCGRIAFDPIEESAFVPPGGARMRLTLAGAESELTDVPVPVFLGDERIDRAVIDTDGTTLRFYSDAGEVLAHELETIGRTGGGALVAWVRVPVIDEPTMIWVAYGDATAPVATQPVWSAEFEGVWHLDTLADSANDHDGVSFGASGSSGLAGSGHHFDGTSYIRVADSASLTFTDQITISAWSRFDSLPPSPDYYALVAREYQDTDFDDFYIGVSLDMMAHNFYLNDGLSFGGGVTVDEWTMLAATYDGATIVGVLNGAVVSTKMDTGNLQHSSNPIFFGGNRNNRDSTDNDMVADFDFLVGKLDEVRIERTARSVEWLRYQYEATLDRVITYGPIER